ncbi:MAG: Yip1 family protein [Pseudomonadota bacterium]
MNDKNDQIVDSRNPYSAPEAELRDVPEMAATIDLTGLAPFRSILIRPRQTIREIIARDPELHVYLIAALSGIANFLDRASMRNAGDELPLWGILLTAFLFGPVSGLLGLWVSYHLIHFTGKWIGGAGSREDIRTAFAWASVPSILSLTVWFLMIAIVGHDMFTEATPTIDARLDIAIFVIVASLATVVFGIWWLVLLSNTIAEAQGFHSAWKGLGNLILTGLVILVVVVCIALLFGVFYSFGQ